MKQLIYILVLLLSFNGWSQKAYVDAAISASTVTSNDQFTYKITTDCDCDIIPPDLSNFDVLQAMPGHYESMQSFNGQSTKKTCTSTMTYVLRGKKKGKFEIGEAKVKCKSADKTSQSFTVEVLNAEDVHKANEGKVDYYFKLESSKEKVRVGEAFVLNFYMYTKKRPQDINAINSGKAGGVYRQSLFNEMASDFAFPMTIKKVKGNDYYVIHLRKEVCIPSAAGKLKIEPYFGRAVEEYDFFSAKYMDGYSNSLEIDVINVPSNAPPNYYGMSGEFNLVHEISATSIQANRAIEMTVEISGIGNFNSFRTPDFLFPESFLVAEPEIEENFDLTEEGIEGKATYTYVITPTKEGQFNILPYSFAYFDRKANNFKSVATESFTINVSEGTGGDIKNTTNTSSVPEEYDIRHIKKGGNLFGISYLFFGTLIFWMLILLPLILLFIFIMAKRKKSRLTDEEVVAKRQKEVKKSTAKQVSKLQSADNDTLNIKGLKSQLEAYLMTNLNISRSQLSKQIISVKLDEKGVDESLKNRFTSLWDKLEMAQYAPVSSDNLGKLANESSSIINELNKVL
ncbi:MAG: BatD family protein [Crocinitomicaceae bacterium]